MNIEEIKQRFIIVDTWKKEIEFLEQRINKELSDIRSKCPHSEFHRIYDASGNNDSEYCCDICGAYSRRKFVTKI